MLTHLTLWGTPPGTFSWSSWSTLLWRLLRWFLMFWCRFFHGTFRFSLHTERRLLISNTYKVQHRRFNMHCHPNLKYCASNQSQSTVKETASHQACQERQFSKHWSNNKHSSLWYNSKDSQAAIEISSKKWACGYAYSVHYTVLFHNQGGYCNWPENPQPHLSHFHWLFWYLWELVYLSALLLLKKKMEDWK